MKKESRRISKDNLYQKICIWLYMCSADITEYTDLLCFLYRDWCLEGGFYAPFLFKYYFFYNLNGDLTIFYLSFFLNAILLYSKKFPMVWFETKWLLPLVNSWWLFFVFLSVFAILYTWKVFKFYSKLWLFPSC